MSASPVLDDVARRESNRSSTTNGTEQLRSTEESSTRQSCEHCGLPVIGQEQVSKDGHHFCCHGCSAAWQLLHSEGLDDYYDLRDRFGGEQGKAGKILAAEMFAELDSPSFHELNVKPLAGGLGQTRLYLEGIHCAACVWLLERLQRLEPSVVTSRVNLTRSTLDLVWDCSQAKLSQIAVTLSKLGYRAHPLRAEVEFQRRASEQRKMLAQIGIAFACSGNSMLLAIALYAGEFYGMSASHVALLRGASTVVGLVSLLGPGATFFKGAWSAIRLRTPHMDIPVALGLGVGAASGLWNTLRGSGELYYDSLSMLVFLLLSGRYLQSRQQQSACDSVELLSQLTPRTARRVRDGLVEVVGVDALQVGDTAEILEGESIPADGKILSGKSEIDQSLLTGETMPVPAAPGDCVTAGSVNRVSPLRITVEAIGSQTRIGKLAQTIQDVGVQRMPLVQLADRIAGRFVIAVVIFASLTAIGWWLYRPAEMVDHVIALLIVACPCALGLATPLAVALALGRGAKQGILIKGGDALQRVSAPDYLLFDKTGTLTTGKMQVTLWELPESVSPSVIALEHSSQHPIAVAIRERNPTTQSTERLPWVDQSTVQYQPGMGLSGVVGGSQVRIGNLNLMTSHNVHLDSKWRTRFDEVSRNGTTPLLVSSNDHVVGLIGLNDQLRPEAKSTIARLQKLGWKVGILSGDHSEVVQQTAGRLSISPDLVFGNQSPEGKLAVVQRLQSDGHQVVMVGDGVNDAAALAKADVGIAVRGGAEVSLQAASIYFRDADLRSLEYLFDASSRTIKTIRRNFFASASYNLFAVCLAALGLIHPLAAAILMPISSLTVVTFTLTSGIFRTRKTEISSDIV